MQVNNEKYLVSRQKFLDADKKLIILEEVYKKKSKNKEGKIILEKYKRYEIEHIKEILNIEPVTIIGERNGFK